MKVAWSEQAIRAIRERFGDGALDLKLAYDAEGCGCAVNGVAALWAVDGPYAEDAQACGVPDGLRLWYDKEQAIFWDEDMRISYNPNYRTFALASNGQIYANRLTVQDRRSIHHTNSR